MNATPPTPEPAPTSYAQAGVDEEREQAAFARVMRPWLARTKVRSPLVTSITGLASGYFATLMHLPPGPPIALTTDGVGTKIMVAEEANRWEPIGVDCVANNVNDLICVGAVPLALLDYIATDRIDEAVLDEVARGLFLGAELAGIAIPGGEIAQIGEMLAKSASGGPTLDLVGTAIGALPPAEGTADGYRLALDGSAVAPGDVVIGLPSSGLHSNGYSLARHALFKTAGLTLDDQVPGSGRRLSDALLQPTRVYVNAAEALWAAGVTPHGMAHISGGGLLNIARLAANVSYELDAVPGRAGAVRPDRERGRRRRRHHVRHPQHGHRLLRGGRRGRPAGRPRRAQGDRRGRRPHRHGDRASWPHGHDPGGRASSARETPSSRYVRFHGRQGLRRGQRRGLLAGAAVCRSFPAAARRGVGRLSVGRARSR